MMMGLQYSGFIIFALQSPLFMFESFRGKNENEKSSFSLGFPAHPGLLHRLRRDSGPGSGQSGHESPGGQD
jgi:hypothetical protein